MSLNELGIRGIIDRKFERRFRELSLFLALPLTFQYPDSLPFKELVTLLVKNYGPERVQKIIFQVMSGPTIGEVLEKNKQFQQQQKNRIMKRILTNRVYRQVTVTARSQLRHNSNKKTSGNSKSGDGGGDSDSDGEPDNNLVLVGCCRIKG